MYSTETVKGLMEGKLKFIILVLKYCSCIYIKLCWYVGVFTLNFGGMVEYFN